MPYIWELCAVSVAIFIILTADTIVCVTLIFAFSLLAILSYIITRVKQIGRLDFTLRVSDLPEH